MNSNQCFPWALVENARGVSSSWMSSNAHGEESQRGETNFKQLLFLQPAEMRKNLPCLLFLLVCVVRSSLL